MRQVIPESKGTVRSSYCPFQSITSSSIPFRIIVIVMIVLVLLLILVVFRIVLVALVFASQFRCYRPQPLLEDRLQCLGFVRHDSRCSFSATAFCHRTSPATDTSNTAGPRTRHSRLPKSYSAVMRARAEYVSFRGAVPSNASKVAVAHLWWVVVQERAGFAVPDMDVTTCDELALGHDTAWNTRKQERTLARAEHHLVVLSTEVTGAGKVGLLVGHVRMSEDETGVVFDHVDTPELRRSLSTTMSETACNQSKILRTLFS